MSGLFRNTLLGLILFLLAAHAVPAGASAVGYLTTCDGTVQARRPGAGSVGLGRGSSVYVGDVVSTAASGRATLLFSDSSQVRLNGNTTISITPHTVGNGETSLFLAVSGEVWARLRSGRAVETRTAIAGVRGTEIDLKVADDGTTTLIVLEGEVHFHNERGAVDVAANQQSVVHPGEAPAIPLTVGNSGMLVQWTLDLGRAAIPIERFYFTLDINAAEAALTKFRNACDARPGDAKAHSNYGDALYDAHQYVAALAEHNKADQIAPHQPMTLLSVGYDLIEQDRLDEAAAAFQSAARAEPQRNEQITILPTGKVSHLTTRYFPALTGLAWVALRRDHPQDVEALCPTREDYREWIGEIIAEYPELPDMDILGRDIWGMSIVQGLAAMRQPDHQSEAVSQFDWILNLMGTGGFGNYQTHAWLALAYLQQGDSARALSEGQLATKLQPNSALAHGNLALVYMFTGSSPQAVREAEIATKLNPDLPAAQLALAQAQLAEGDADAAETTAARVVDLDPGLAQGYYLLGLAEANRRDYVHAVRRLRDCLRQAPNFLPAATLLATVYTRMGQPDDAVALLTKMAPHYPQSAEMNAALGQMYYEQARYTDSEKAYRDAQKAMPNSALYHARLARVLADDNKLNEAIREGQQAVYLAPRVAQFHALLGQIYDFSDITFQSELEFREAISLDPTNALARIELALKTNDPQVALDTYSQAFLYDPQISQQVMRGGIASEFTAQAGTDALTGLHALHQGQADNGKLNYLGGLSRQNNNGDGSRNNDFEDISSGRLDATYQLNPPTNIYANIARELSGQGLAGPTSGALAGDSKATASARFDQGQIAMRHRTANGGSFWLGFTYQRLRNSFSNPQGLLNPTLGVPFSTLFPYVSEGVADHALIPEARYDFNFSHDPERPSILTFGATQANLHPTLSTGPIVLVIPPGLVAGAPSLTQESHERFSVAYTQLQQTLSNKLSFVAQVRAQRDDYHTLLTSIGGGVPSQQAITHLLPGLELNYQAQPKTLLRLLVDDQAQTTDLALAPTDTRLIVEPGILPFGQKFYFHIYEADADRQLAGRAFLKLYAFHAMASNLVVGRNADTYTNQVTNPFTLRHLWQDGAGARYSRPLTHTLQGQAGILFSRTNADAPGEIFDGGDAPYYPTRTGTLALNYVDERGNKAAVSANYVGPFFADAPAYVGVPAPASRPRFASQTYFNILLAREPTVEYEYFIGVNNIFNRAAIVFSEVPDLSYRRHWYAGVTRRIR